MACQPNGSSGNVGPEAPRLGARAAAARIHRAALAEAEARRCGATQLGLNVFGANHVARSLYTSLGYEISRLQMHNAL